MSRLTLIEGLLRNLAGEIGYNRREFLPVEEAYLRLKQLTGQDFGYDVKQWRQWLKDHPQRPANSKSRPAGRAPTGKKSQRPEKP